MTEVLRERGARLDRRWEPDELQHARWLRESDEGASDGAGRTEALRRAMVASQEIVDEAVGESTRRASEARRKEVAG